MVTEDARAKTLTVSGPDSNSLQRKRTPKRLQQPFLALDLEMNMHSRRIIQIGAVVGDMCTGEVIDKLSVFVNPEEPIDPYITDLTGITQETINEQGVSLIGAYSELARFHMKHKAFVNPITWDGGDSQELRSQLESSGVVFSKEKEKRERTPWCFGRRWLDAKTLFTAWRISHGQPCQGGLSRSMLKLGLKFQGRKHDACDDALNTFRLFRRLLEEFV